MRGMLRAAICAVLFLVAAVQAAGQFFLTETRDKSVAGPYTMYDGAKVRIGGVLYEIQSRENDRASFVSTADKSSFGPFQLVDGRIMRIGDGSYSFSWKSASRNQAAPVASHSAASASAGVPRPVREKPIAEFDPIPPKPEMLDVPEPERQRTVAPLNLPALPNASRPLAWAAWLAPVDMTPVEWSVESASGSNSDIKRFSVGGAITLNSWLAEAQLSTGVKCGEIIPEGLGISNSSMDDGSGWSLGVGYKRPFLREDGWTASAGLFGRIRQDKGDLTATTLVSTGSTDTNNLGNVYSEFETSSSSVKVTELTLRIDLELAYEQEFWKAYVDILVQPVSEMDVSGGIRYGDDMLGVSAKHNDPIGLRVGGWYELDEGWRVAGDLTVGMESLLRLGVMREF